MNNGIITNMNFRIGGNQLVSIVMPSRREDQMKITTRTPNGAYHTIFIDTDDIDIDCKPRKRQRKREEFDEEKG